MQFITGCALLAIIGEPGAAFQFLLGAAFFALFTPWPWLALAALLTTKDTRP
jgi:hypothetical protein